MDTETSALEIVNTRAFPECPEQVFNAFAAPDRLALWWGPKGFTNTFNTFDFRSGGPWNFIMHSPDGQNFKNECVFLDIERPGRIVISHLSAPKFVLEITLDETQRGMGTQLTWVQRFETAEMRDKILKIAGQANEEVLDRLAAVLAGAPSVG